MTSIRKGEKKLQDRELGRCRFIVILLFWCMCKIRFMIKRNGRPNKTYRVILLEEILEVQNYQLALSFRKRKGSSHILSLSLFSFFKSFFFYSTQD